MEGAIVCKCPEQYENHTGTGRWHYSGNRHLWSLDSGPNDDVKGGGIAIAPLRRLGGDEYSSRRFGQRRSLYGCLDRQSSLSETL
jgi:hypothetical protein